MVPILKNTPETASFRDRRAPMFAVGEPWNARALGHADGWVQADFILVGAAVPHRHRTLATML
jgi:hypothetical protein